MKKYRSRRRKKEKTPIKKFGWNLLDLMVLIAAPISAGYGLIIFNLTIRALDKILILHQSLTLYDWFYLSYPLTAVIGMIYLWKRGILKLLGGEREKS